MIAPRCHAPECEVMFKLSTARPHKDVVSHRLTACVKVQQSAGVDDNDYQSHCP